MIYGCCSPSSYGSFQKWCIAYPPNKKGHVHGENDENYELNTLEVDGMEDFPVQTNP